MDYKRFLELWNSDNKTIMSEIRQLQTKMTKGQLCMYYIYFILLIILVCLSVFYALYLLIFAL